MCFGCHNQHDTGTEWLNSAYGPHASEPRTKPETTCLDCHMPSVERPLVKGGPVRKGRRHTWPGGHDLDHLRKAAELDVEVEPLPDGGHRFRVWVTNVGAGHNMPTDARHRSFDTYVKLWDEKGNVILDPLDPAQQSAAHAATYRKFYRDSGVRDTQIPPLAARLDDRGREGLRRRAPGGERTWRGMARLPTHALGCARREERVATGSLRVLPGPPGHQGELRVRTVNVAPRLLLVLLLIVGPACRGGSRRVSLDLPQAPQPLATDLVGAQVGRLLSADEAASRAAENRLTTLDADGQKALLRHAETIPEERDPRWLLVLEENHALPELAASDEIAYLVWKAGRAETYYVMKAQGRLLDLARTNPDDVLRALETGAEGRDVLAVALALAGERRAFPPLRALYAEATSPADRRVAAEALTQLTGGEVQPRVLGSPADIAASAERLDAWWETHGPVVEESR